MDRLIRCLTARLIDTPVTVKLPCADGGGDPVNRTSFAMVGLASLLGSAWGGGGSTARPTGGRPDRGVGSLGPVPQRARAATRELGFVGSGLARVSMKASTEAAFWSARKAASPSPSTSSILRRSSLRKEGVK